MDADADLSLRSLPKGLWSSTVDAASLDVMDVWHFEYFRVVCTAQLSLVFGTPGMWERLVLHTAFSEPCILQGILALGALSRNVVPRTTSVSSSERKSTFLPGYNAEYSWGKYNLAIGEMNRRLGREVDVSSAGASGWELAVLGGLIFIIIEVIQGNEDVARIHLRAAWAIWESCQASTSMYLTPEGKRNMGRVLDAFSRLDLQSILPPLDQGDYLVPLQFPVLPSCFLSTEAARDSLNAISGAMNSLGWKRAVLEHQTRTQPTQPRLSLHLTLMQGRSTLSHLLDSWLALFKSYTSHCPPSDAKTTTCTPILLIQYHILQINMSCLSPSHLYASPSELGYNAHISRFSSIIDLAHTILKAQRESYPAPIRTQPGSNFHVAVVQPLFFVACKCRDALLRRRAIEALEKVNGMSSEHSRLLARVARWVVEMEEGRSYFSVTRSPAVAVREEAMLSDVEAGVPDAGGGCRVTAWKRWMDGEWHEISGYVAA